MQAHPYATEFDCSLNSSGHARTRLISAPINLRMVRQTPGGGPTSAVDFIGQSIVTVSFLPPGQPAHGLGSHWQLLQHDPESPEATAATKLVGTLADQRGYERLLMGTKISLPLHTQDEIKGFDLHFDMPYHDSNGGVSFHASSLSRAEAEHRARTGSYAASIGDLLANARNLRIEGPYVQFGPEFNFWARSKPDESSPLGANSRNDNQASIDERPDEKFSYGELPDIREEEEGGEAEEYLEQHRQAQKAYEETHPWFPTAVGVSHICTLGLMTGSAAPEWYFARDQPAILTETGDVQRPVPVGIVRRHLDQESSKKHIAVIEARLTNADEVRQNQSVEPTLVHEKDWTTPTSSGVLIRRVIGQEDIVLPVTYRDTVTVSMPSPGDIWEDGQLKPADDPARRSLMSRSVLPAIIDAMTTQSESSGTNFVKQTIHERLTLPEHRLNQQETRVTWKTSDGDVHLTLAELENRMREATPSGGRIDPKSFIGDVTRIDLKEQTVDLSTGFEVRYKNSTGAPISATVIASMPLNPQYVVARMKHRKWHPADGLQASHSRMIEMAKLRRAGATTLRRRRGEDETD